MSRKLPLHIAAIAVAVALTGAACATSGASADRQSAEDVAKFAAAQQHAGEPRNTVRFLRPIHRYEVVAPQAILVWETPSKAWLVDLRKSAACRHLERSWAVAIDTLNDTLNTSNGYVLGEDGLRCKIDRIREVDVPAMRETLRESGNA
ncbi:DUF6491 family protein [Arenimonas composti]|uniref:Lipoprotein n=1 Tax=Arenimonas composti TR7-09 = DSM 18010 TaxID=1121013 RepID=A0A091BEJ5_9GAMM|nr:DUF6491 family protein [Arenimonas composti]KFN51108.1 hypothetical protein P873_04190 [Arenimonas composti TR7-09 = DSM 18010]